MFRHIVLFRVHDGVTDAEVDAAIAMLRSVGAAVGAAGWRVERSTDTRKGRVIVEDATFDSRAAFASFVAHPAHRAAGEAMARLSDWSIGDYETPDP